MPSRGDSLADIRCWLVQGILQAVCLALAVQLLWKVLTCIIFLSKNSMQNTSEQAVRHPHRWRPNVRTNTC